MLVAPDERITVSEALQHPWLRGADCVDSYLIRHAVSTHLEAALAAIDNYCDVFVKSDAQTNFRWSRRLFNRAASATRQRRANSAPNDKCRFLRGAGAGRRARVHDHLTQLLDRRRGLAVHDVHERLPELVG
ncbi:hypothetical protein GQ600_14532 [Phytophthora cactorum]|nr:hypothetical protein GQ600_14532 [Phytophthora cactorum]